MSNQKKELLVNWTTDNIDTAMSMVLLYTYNAKKLGWFDEITLLIWGASQKLVATNTEVQEQIKMMKDVGIKVIACKKCAEDKGVADELIACDIEVFYTGEVLTPWLLEGKPFLSV